jgi:hypothetical protein
MKQLRAACVESGFTPGTVSTMLSRYITDGDFKKVGQLITIRKGKVK